MLKKKILYQMESVNVSDNIFAKTKSLNQKNKIYIHKFY